METRKTDMAAVQIQQVNSAPQVRPQTAQADRLASEGASQGLRTDRVTLSSRGQELSQMRARGESPQVAGVADPSGKTAGTPGIGRGEEAAARAQASLGAVKQERTGGQETLRSGRQEELRSVQDRGSESRSSVQEAKREINRQENLRYEQAKGEVETTKQGREQAELAERVQDARQRANSTAEKSAQQADLQQTRPAGRTTASVNQVNGQMQTKPMRQQGSQIQPSEPAPIQAENVTDGSSPDSASRFEGITAQTAGKKVNSATRTHSRENAPAVSSPPDGGNTNVNLRPTAGGATPEQALRARDVQQEVTRTLQPPAGRGGTALRQQGNLLDRVV